MSVRDAAVFDVFMQNNMSGWRWEHGSPAQPDQHGDAGIWLVDLGGMGWAKGDADNQAKLLAVIASQPAVLLISANNQTWSNLKTKAPLSHCAWLTKPYSAERLREVLTGFVQGAQTPSQPPPQDKGRSSAALPTSVGQPEKNTRPNPALASSEASLSADALAAELQSVAKDKFPLLRRLSSALARQQPFELRFTVQNSLIVHPVNQWVSSNTPIEVIARVCQSNALSSSVMLREIDTAEAEERTLRLGMKLIDLEVFLFDLTQHSGWTPSR